VLLDPTAEVPHVNVVIGCHEKLTHLLHRSQVISPAMTRSI